jgi:putative membrane protein
MLWSGLVYQIVHRRFPTLLPWVKDADFVIGLGSFTAPISLLLALRTNRALNRLLEGRSMWGTLVRASTTLAGLAATYIQPKDSNVALLMGRYLAILGWSLKGFLRNEEDTEVLRTVLPPDEANWVERSPGDHPTAIICRLRQLMASQVKDLPLVAAQAMEDRLAELEVAIGTCKRLLGSPIPPTYTRHTSRVLCLYLGMVPLALVGNSKAGLSAILINVALLSYVFVGIDEIGVEIEHPFPLLPMHHLSKVTQDNVGNQFIMSL